MCNFYVFFFSVGLFEIIYKDIHSNMVLKAKKKKNTIFRELVKLRSTYADTMKVAKWTWQLCKISRIYTVSFFV